MLQKKFGGMVIQLDRAGNPQQVPLWTLDKEEADMVVSAIDGVRTKLPMMPEKWALPMAAVWLGGVVLFTFSSRISIYKQLKAQAVQEQQMQARQNVATAGRQNGVHPEAVSVPGGLPPVTPDGEPPADWDGILREAQ